MASRQRTWVTDLKWEASAGEFSPDGKSFTYVLNAGGRTDIYMVDRSSGRGAVLPFAAGITVPSGNSRAYSPSGDSPETQFAEKLIVRLKPGVTHLVSAGTVLRRWDPGCLQVQCT
jgi:hypothetical protein